MTAKILLVEDDRPTLIALSVNLRADGHEVIPLPSGRMVSETVTRDCPDLVILDILMPDTNGVEALDMIRGISPSLPVVVCSGAPDMEPFVQYASISAFLLKPIDFGLLRETVAQALSARAVETADRR